MAELKPDNTDREMLASIADSVSLLGKTMADSLAALTARVDSACERMDAMEEDRKDADDKDEARDDADKDGEIKEKGDPKDVVADRKDSDRKDEDDKDRKDSAEESSREGIVADRKDSDKEDRKDDDDADMADSVARTDIAALRAQIKALEARTPAIMADSEREKFAAIQEAAEPAFQAFGDKAPAPLAGETTLAYRRRLIGKHQQHSSAWKEARLTAIADEATLETIGKAVFADSISASRKGVGAGSGRMIPIRTQMIAGQTKIEYRNGEDWTNSFRVHSKRA